MAINWGIALGQAAKTGLDMYERLGEEELRAMQRDKMRKDLQQEKALDALYAEKLGKVGKDVSTFTPDTATPETGYYPQGTEPKEALPTGRAGANYVSDSDGMALKETTKQYTQKEAFSDIAKEAGVVGGRKGAMEAMQYKSAARASGIEEKFDASMEKLNNTLATIQGTAESGGLKGLADAAKKEGLKVEFVEGKNSVGKINVLGPKGDVIETVTSVGDATSKLEQLAMKNFMNSNLSLLGSYDKVAAYMQGNRKLDIDEQANKDKGAYYKSEATLNEARIGQINETKAGREAAKPFMDKYQAMTPEQRNGPEGQQLLKDAAVATAIKTGDFRALAKDSPEGRAADAFDKAVQESQKNGTPMPNRAEFFGNYGIAPPEVVQGQQTKVDDLVKQGKTKEAEELVKKHNNVFPHSKLKMGEVKPIPVNEKGIPVKANASAPAIKAAMPAGTTAAGTPVAETNWAKGLQTGRMTTLEKELAAETNPRAKMAIQAKINKLKETS
jgi:hypothetical protein